MRAKGGEKLGTFVYSSSSATSSSVCLLSSLFHLCPRHSEYVLTENLKLLQDYLNPDQCYHFSQLAKSKRMVSFSPDNPLDQMSKGTREKWVENDFHILPWQTLKWTYSKNQFKNIIILLRKQSKFKAEENMLKSSEIPSSIINSEQLPKSPLDFKAH